MNLLVLNPSVSISAHMRCVGVCLNLIIQIDISFEFDQLRRRWILEIHMFRTACKVDSVIVILHQDPKCFPHNMNLSVLNPSVSISAHMRCGSIVSIWYFRLIFLLSLISSGGSGYLRSTCFGLLARWM
ncbi:hypothetical protein KP509_32G016900 [Ceratopteris richardii]|uniref:Uncharacterized protein n=1 Tax=Ceratopteris richardii TaxID=49495 RepID=A0A8T2QSU7_CERRI|nr:hypothetical protein KP509_32G016900 [Ceratopteris richardii]